MSFPGELKKKIVNMMMNPEKSKKKFLLTSEINLDVMKGFNEGCAMILRLIDELQDEFIKKEEKKG